MPKYHHSKRGYTLVEIMVVVVIIGLLAAMAIPLYQRIRRTAIHSRMDNDARQIASAAQQYFAEFATTTVVVGYDPATGMIAAPLSSWCKHISISYTVPASIDANSSFVFDHPLAAAPRTYNPEGQQL